MICRESTSPATDSAANSGFEAKLCFAADKLWNNMDVAEYKHDALRLSLLKCISDSFEEVHARPVAGPGEYEGAGPEYADEYRAESAFWIPREARWAHLQSNTKRPAAGEVVELVGKDRFAAMLRMEMQLK